MKRIKITFQVVISVLLFTSLLYSDQSEENSLIDGSLHTTKEINSAERYKPLYITSYDKYYSDVGFLPVREISRWGLGTLGIGNFMLISTGFAKNECGTICSDFIPPKYLYGIMAGTGAIIGLPIGITKFILYRKQYKRGNIIYSNEPIISSEFKYAGNKYKYTASSSLIFKQKVLNFEEVLLSATSSIWLRNEDKESEKIGFENKVFIGLSDVYKYGDYIAPYYNLLAGISKAKYGEDHHSINIGKKSFVGLGQVGVKVNLYDICFLKMEGEYEFSPFYYHLKSRQDYDFGLKQRANYSFGIVFGTDIY
jgi:hypothetical protein